jgi:hypothetical protein
VQLPPELLGPLGLTVALCFAVFALWHSHIAADDDVRRQRDAAVERLAKMVEAVDRNSDGLEKLAQAFREYIAEQSGRTRRGDR